MAMTNFTAEDMPELTDAARERLNRGDDEVDGGKQITVIESTPVDEIRSDYDGTQFPHDNASAAAREDLDPVTKNANEQINGAPADAPDGEQPLVAGAGPDDESVVYNEGENVTPEGQDKYTEQADSPEPTDLASGTDVEVVNEAPAAAKHGKPSHDENGIPNGSAAEVLEWVGDDPEKAQQALDKESAANSPRKGLTADLKDIAGK